MVVAVANQKGGCAKTTTAVNLAAALAKGSPRQGLPKAKVLLIDLDPQGNCATSFGVEKKNIKKTAYDLLANDSGEDLPLMEEYLIGPEELTQSMRDAWSLRNNNKKAPDNLSVGHLWLLPSDIHLSGAEIELSHKIGRETRLREALIANHRSIRLHHHRHTPFLGSLVDQRHVCGQLGHGPGSGRILRP